MSPQPIIDRSLKVSTYRTYSIDVHITSSSVAAVEDFERELRARLRRAVNNRAMAKRHDVEVRPPGTLSKRNYADSEFYVHTSATPLERRSRR